MSKLGNIKPPDDVTEPLREYLSRLFLQIDISLGQNNKIAVSGALPDKPQDGNIYYFSQIIAPDITSIGFWGYENSAWLKL